MNSCDLVFALLILVVVFMFIRLRKSSHKNCSNKKVMTTIDMQQICGRASPKALPKTTKAPTVKQAPDSLQDSDPNWVKPLPLYNLSFEQRIMQEYRDAIAAAQPTQARAQDPNDAILEKIQQVQRRDRTALERRSHWSSDQFRPYIENELREQESRVWWEVDQSE